MNLDQILRRGNERVETRFDKRRILFVNITLLLLFFGSFSAIVVANNTELKILGYTTTAVLALLYFLHGYYPKIVVRAMMVYFQFVLFMHSSVYEQGLYIEYGYVVLAAGLPILFRKKWSVFFLITSVILFYFPYVVLGVYESYFKIGFIPGAVLYFVMTNFVKEIEENEQRLISKNNELVDLNKEKNSLIGIVAHDLKSPLNQIRGLINLINYAESKPSEEVQMYIDKINNSAVKMFDMITQILDTELLDNRKMVLHLEPVSPYEIISEVASEFELLGMEKGIVINNKIKQSETQVLADKQSLMHVLQNLVSNAIKFSPLNEQIELSLEETDSKVKMKVSDHGPGLTDDDKSKLFQKYQKLSAKPTGGEISTGLGLAIVKKFMNAMNGEIWCESENGKGATFIVELNKASFIKAST